MTHARSTLLLALTGALLVTSGCATTRRPVSQKLDSRLLGGIESTASIEVPSDWHQETKRPNRAVFVGPDNFSRIYFTTQESLTPVTECDALVRRSIEQFKAEQARGGNVEVELTQAGAGAPQVAYDFRMVVPGNPPGPTDRHFVGRAACDAGGIGVVACAVGRNRVKTLGTTCDEVVSSLTLKPATAGDAAETAPAPAAEQPAPPTANETPADPTPSGSQPIDQPQADPLPNQQPPEANPEQNEPAPQQ